MPLIILLPLFFSCSARIDGVLREGGAAELTVRTSLEPRTTALIRRVMGASQDTPVLDGPAISRSMAGAPGVGAVSLNNTSLSALEGSISVSNVGDFLTDTENRFITYTEGRGAGDSSIVIELNRDTVSVLLPLLSPELEDYLSALLAPVVLGEHISRQEYLDLLAMFYSRALADEIAAARLRTFINFPRPVTAVLGGRAAGNSVEFDIPLVDILVLESPLRYEVKW